MIWILRHKSWLSSTENRFSDGGLNKTNPRNQPFSETADISNHP